MDRSHMFFASHHEHGPRGGQHPLWETMGWHDRFRHGRPDAPTGPRPGPRGGPHRGPHGHHGGGPFGGFPFDRWFQPRSKAGRGDVRAAILTLLTEQSLHGYQIMQEIGRRSGGVWQPSPGSVYPALQQLEDEGLVQATASEGRRVFTLTDEGLAYIATHQADLAAPWEAMSEGVDEAVAELHNLAGQLAAVAVQVARAGTASQITAAQRVLADSRRQLYRILAEDEAPVVVPPMERTGSGEE